MAPAIVKFVRTVCRKYNLSAHYLAKNDVYMIHKDNRIVYAIRGSTFFNVPIRHRLYEILPILKVGLNHNLGEKYYSQTFRPRHGKKIC